jgi:hypothetical protein
MEAYNKNGDYLKGICNSKFVKRISKAIPITGLGGLWGCEMLRIPHCLDDRQTDGGKVVIPTHQLHFTPQETLLFLCFWYSFLLEAE